MLELPRGNQYKRGYRAPRDVVVKTTLPLQLIDKYWPKTKLIVDVRHPVKWMQSYYNFKTGNACHRRRPWLETVYHLRLCFIRISLILARRIHMVIPMKQNYLDFPKRKKAIVIWRWRILSSCMIHHNPPLIPIGLELKYIGKI